VTDSLAQSLVDAAARSIADFWGYIKPPHRTAAVALSTALERLAEDLDERHAELNARELRTYAREIREGRCP